MYSEGTARPDMNDGKSVGISSAEYEQITGFSHRVRPHQER